MTTTIYKRFTDEGLTLDSEIERLTARVKELEQRVAEANKGARINAEVNKSLAAKVNRYRAALEHYADESNWAASQAINFQCDYMGREPHFNGFEVARTALKEEKDEK